jgi:hypothetical protein
MAKAVVHPLAGARSCAVPLHLLLLSMGLFYLGSIRIIWPQRIMGG